MKITLENTDRMVNINGNTQARVWEGETDTGLSIVALITRLAIPGNKLDDQVEQFDKELAQQKEVSDEAIQTFPLRVVFVEK